jgi:hypothetical protein
MVRILILTAVAVAFGGPPKSDYWSGARSDYGHARWIEISKTGQVHSLG